MPRLPEPADPDVADASAAHAALDRDPDPRALREAEAQARVFGAPEAAGRDAEGAAPRPSVSWAPALVAHQSEVVQPGGLAAAGGDHDPPLRLPDHTRR